MHHPSVTLKSPTFIGLLLAQFTATFNDQAVHFFAIFYASDILVRYLNLVYVDEKAVVSIVTACFITPFILFSPYAGELADKYSKRTIIVFWKIAEVGMMSLTLLGLCLPHLAGWSGISLPTLSLWSAILVIATVFLMGTHSTFFVPAKYGVMPEILHPAVLSRGNGLLEGTSFTAQIFGTSAGGILYALFKPNVEPSELTAGQNWPGQEWVIGLLLVLLALIGTGTSFLMGPVPVAAPGRKFTWSWWRPLQENLQILWRSKPLTLAVIGIAFAAFMTLILRQTLLYDAEIIKELRYAQAESAAASDGGKPVFESRPNAGAWSKLIPVKLGSAAQQAELRVSLLIALVGFGVGVGSLLAGYLSGQRVELGLFPIGGLGMALITFVMAFMLHSVWTVISCLFLIGLAAGFYIVPLYTLLQHRAPKKSKGNVVAASNFLNVLGGVLAVAAFYLLAFILESLFGASLSAADVKRHPELRTEFIRQLNAQLWIPQFLFMATGLITAAVLVVLYLRLPDFFVRTAIWIRAHGANRLRTSGLENLPVESPVILVVHCARLDMALNILAATDCYTRVVALETMRTPATHPWLRWLAGTAGMISLTPDASRAEWESALQIGLKTLQRGDIVALAADPAVDDANLARLLEAWQTGTSAMVLPVYYSGKSTGPAEPPPTLRQKPRIVVGAPLPRPARLDQIYAAIERVQHGDND